MVDKKTVIVIAFAAFFGGILLAKYILDKRKESDPTPAVPQSLTLPEPKPEKNNAEIKVKAGALLTFIVTGNNKLFYYKGDFANHLIKTDYTSARVLITDFKKQTAPADLMYLIKAAPNASFKNTIDLLDEMSICEIPPGHYAEVEITGSEIESINNYKED